MVPLTNPVPSTRPFSSPTSTPQGCHTSGSSGSVWVERRSGHGTGKTPDRPMSKKRPNAFGGISRREEETQKVY